MRLFAILLPRYIVQSLGRGDKVRVKKAGRRQVKVRAEVKVGSRSASERRATIAVSDVEDMKIAGASGM